MAETNAPQEQRGPWRKAFREARSVVVVAFLIAVTYNIFATTSIPWLREASKHDSTATATLADTSASAKPAATDTVIEAHPAVPVDTAATPMPATADTALKGLTAAARDSALKAQRDSSRTAKLEAAHTRDSADQAGILSILASGKDITTDIARKIYDRKLAQFIDARPEDQFNEGHIVNAMNVYAEQWQSSIPDLIKIPKDRPIVTYCGGGDECELSRDLAKSLRTLGFKSVVVYTGGIKDWTAKKYPTSTAP